MPCLDSSSTRSYKLRHSFLCSGARVAGKSGAAGGRAGKQLHPFFRFVPLPWSTADSDPVLDCQFAGGTESQYILNWHSLARVLVRRSKSFRDVGFRVVHTRVPSAQYHGRKVLLGWTSASGAGPLWFSDAQGHFVLEHRDSDVMVPREW